MYIYLSLFILFYMHKKVEQKRLTKISNIQNDLFSYHIILKYRIFQNQLDINFKTKISIGYMIITTESFIFAMLIIA